MPARSGTIIQVYDLFRTTYKFLNITSYSGKNVKQQCFREIARVEDTVWERKAVKRLINEYFQFRNDPLRGPIRSLHQLASEALDIPENDMRYGRVAVRTRQYSKQKSRTK